jgi:ATPase subunit of ABC transporter with duplicated ATPase domains
MLLVSHDERFLARLARKRWALSETAPGRVVLTVRNEFP